jgi:hypothetical protein
MSLGISRCGSFDDATACIAKFLASNPSDQQRHEAACELGQWFLDTWQCESLVSDWAKLFQKLLPSLPFMLMIHQDHPANKEFQAAHNHKIQCRGLASLIEHCVKQAGLVAQFFQNPERTSNKGFALAIWNLAVLVEFLDLKSKINWPQMIVQLVKNCHEPSPKYFNWPLGQTMERSKMLRKMVILWWNFTTPEQRQSLLDADQTGVLRQIPHPEQQSLCPCHVPWKILRDTKDLQIFCAHVSSLYKSRKSCCMLVLADYYDHLGVHIVSERFRQEARHSVFATQTPFQPRPPRLPSPFEVLKFWWKTYQKNPSETAYQMLVLMDWTSNFQQISSPRDKALKKILEKWPATVSNWWKKGNRSVRLRQFVDRDEPNRNHMRLRALYFQEKHDKLAQKK